ncbi:MAG: R3H domain-containing nucleic acid-binding protein [Thermosynechococcaceae cyanobacterium]
MADRQTQSAEDWLKTVLSHCGLSVSVGTDLSEAIATRLHQFGGQWLTIDDAALSAEQTSLLLGDKGATLDALQYLVNATLNLGQQAAEPSVHTIELAGFRETRYLQLAQMAEAVAQQARQTGQEAEMTPLPPAERRLIHTLLSEEPDLETYSRGQEPQRRLVVGLKSADVGESSPGEIN